MASSEASPLVAFNAEVGMAMSRRIEIVDTCEHGKLAKHWWYSEPRWYGNEEHQDVLRCPGGSRTVLDPEEWVEKAGKVPCKEFDGNRYVASTVGHVLSPSEIRAVLESVLGEKETP